MGIGILLPAMLLLHTMVFPSSFVVLSILMRFLLRPSLEEVYPVSWSVCIHFLFLSSPVNNLNFPPFVTDNTSYNLA